MLFFFQSKAIMTLKEAVRTFVVRRKISQAAINAMSTQVAESVTQCLSRARCPIPQAIVAKTSVAEQQRLSACAYWHVRDVVDMKHVMTAEMASHQPTNWLAYEPKEIQRKQS